MPSKIAVAVSGGIDSMSLLFILKDLKISSAFSHLEIFPITVDHKIRKNSSTQCQKIHHYLLQYFPNHQILTAQYQTPPQANIENIARNERYDLLTNFCHQNQIKHLFLGHHKQDVAENFLIRLFRGSGIDGLSAIEEVSNLKNIKLIRPLLDCEKFELEQHLKDNNLKYFHDSSNDEAKYLRNKIRFFLNDFPQKNLINQRIIAASRNILESKKTIEEDMLIAANNFIEFSSYGYVLVNLTKLIAIAKQKYLRYLSWILIEIGGQIYKPRLEKLQNLVDRISKKKDFKTTIHGCIIEVNKNYLLCYREKSKVENLLIKQKSGRLLWDNRYIIKYDNKITDLFIFNISPSKLNKFIKIQNISKTIIQKFPKKEILQIFPVIVKDQKIICFPFLDWVDKDYKNQINFKISFNFRSPLGKIYENSPI